MSETSTLPTGSSNGGNTPLLTENGKTNIADSVVSKIAGIAAREISGVHSMGSTGSRALGAIRDVLPGNSQGRTVSQGVSVEVGERQAAVDLDVVIDYGVPIVDVSNAIRRNVTERVERMTGLEVTEVNIYVDDVYLPEEEPAPEPERVQ